jgi:hypothetical protein
MASGVECKLFLVSYGARDATEEWAATTHVIGRRASQALRSLIVLGPTASWP